jgi:hypothetical protein
MSKSDYEFLIGLLFMIAGNTTEIVWMSSVLYIIGIAHMITSIVLWLRHGE